MFERVLRAVIPAANPDFDASECLYERVRVWWIELDEAGEPQRELGFDANGTAIVAGPFENNFGFFTDSRAAFSPDDFAAIEQERFDADWIAFANRWKISHR